MTGFTGCRSFPAARIGFNPNHFSLGVNIADDVVQILDLKGTPKAAQNALLDTFLTTTSTKTDLESTSFLSSLDMDPSAHPSSSLISPSASRVSLPLVVGTPTSEGQPAASGAAEGALGGRPSDQRREVFSDFKRFVSFGLRKDSLAP